MNSSLAVARGLFRAGNARSSASHQPKITTAKSFQPVSGKRSSPASSQIAAVMPLPADRRRPATSTTTARPPPWGDSSDSAPSSATRSVSPIAAISRSRTSPRERADRRPGEHLCWAIRTSHEGVPAQLISRPCTQPEPSGSFSTSLRRSDSGSLPSTARSPSAHSPDQAAPGSIRSVLPTARAISRSSPGRLHP